MIKQMQEYIIALENEFKLNADHAIAANQKAYMRNQFEFYGIMAVQRREISKPFLVKAYLPNKEDLTPLIKALWQKPQREFQHFAMDLMVKYVKQFEKEDLELLEYMVTHKSWWDTVDMVSTKLMGAYFKLFPEEIKENINKWLQSNNMWLQRSTLLFQLKYKADLDTKLLTHCIHHLLGSKEFFINKAIGWILRQYSTTNPDWVLDFVDVTDLAPLSRKEAIRLIK
jgi:3-methyladenine DNA glycosylase AlkD